jgi:16S rRNA (guanine966-N2)-methyltransferase
MTAGRMRIIAGAWRGRPIEAPSGQATRPTSERAREALFSMLASRLGSFEDLRVVDLFAGCGALGLEALSRGATHCAFFETDRAAIEALKRNVDYLDAKARTDIRQQSALSAGGGPYDLVLMDPPYGSGLGQQALAALAGRGAIAPGAWISLETATKEDVEVEGFEVVADRRHGKAKLTLLTPRT